MSTPPKTGKVIAVSGNMVSVRFDTVVMQNEVAYILVEGARLKSEVIRIRGNDADLQVFESTNGIHKGDPVEFTGELLSVQLGPGLLTQVFDGLQNPLPQLAEKSGFFLERGEYLYPLDKEKTWSFTPSAKVGDVLTAGEEVGSVPEGLFRHRIMVPFAWLGEWKITWVAEAGDYNIVTPVAKATNGHEERNITMVQAWPVKIPISCYKEKMLASEPLVTKMRIIDTFFPIAKGGTFCTPGPFGAGKTVLQHNLSRNSEADIVIVAACGERAGEVVEILREFPHLKIGRAHV